MLGFGWALLDAQTGENRPHSHLAHQISLSLVDSCSINADRDLRLSPGEAVLIPATTVHRLTPSGAILRNLYVDPFFMGTRDLNKSVGLERLSTAEANALALVGSGNEARKWMEGFLNRKGSNQIDPRLRSTLQRIEPGASPSELAKAVGVSTTRMREIAIRDFGVPTTKLLQWLQVQRAIEGFHQSHSRRGRRWVFRSSAFYPSFGRMVRRDAITGSRKNRDYHRALRRQRNVQYRGPKGA